MKDSPNPKASIGIVCNCPFFYLVQKSVYGSLSDRAEIIVDFVNQSETAIYPEIDKEKFRELLRRDKVFWREVGPDLTKQEFSSKYHTLIGTFHQGLIAHPCNRDKYKIRVFYGVAKDLWMYGLWNSHFDLICAPSEFYKQKLSELYGGDIVVTGEPKFDIGLSLTKAECRISLGLTNQPQRKKTLLIAVTWGSLSSLSIFLPYIIKLTQQFEVMIKLHHQTSTHEQQYENDFAGTEVKVIDQFVPIVQAIRSADVLISDNSGIIFDAIQLRIPLVLLDFIGPNNEVFYTEKPFYGMSVSGKLQGVATSSNSDEQIIKKPGSSLSPVVPLYKNLSFTEKFKLLIDAVEDSSDTDYKERQDYFNKCHFNELDGNAGERIGELVLDRIANRDPLRQKRFISELVEDLTHRINHNHNHNHNQKLLKNNYIFEKRLKWFEEIKTLPMLEKCRRIMFLLK